MRGDSPVFAHVVWNRARAAHVCAGFGSHAYFRNFGRCQLGVRFLQVETVAATAPSNEYAETREFYNRRGFTPIEVFPTLWDPHNPALQYIKVLNKV